MWHPYRSLLAALNTAESDPIQFAFVLRMVYFPGLCSDSFLTKKHILEHQNDCRIGKAQVNRCAEKRNNPSLHRKSTRLEPKKMAFGFQPKLVLLWVEKAMLWALFTWLIGLTQLFHLSHSMSRWLPIANFTFWFSKQFSWMFAHLKSFF